MVEVDYIIVGCGLAGIAFCEKLRAHGKSFTVFDDDTQQSSIVAAGLYNPVILKRFTPVWKAEEQLQLAIPYYQSLEDTLKVKLDYPLQLLRRFASVEEQNLWFTAHDHPKLEAFLRPKIIKNTNAAINASFGFGEVKGAGRLDTTTLVKNYKQYLKANNELNATRLNYNAIDSQQRWLYYDTYKAKHIVFAEGFGLKQNPFFNHLPLNGTKGEVIVIKAPALHLDAIVKSSVFLVPLGQNLYKVGATYNWKDKSNLPTEAGKSELIKKLKTFIKCDFEVVNHSAGIRPTVKDRRPLVGAHHKLENYYVLNGLGTRGVMNAPYAADALFNYIEYGEALDAEMDIIRFSD